MNHVLARAVSILGHPVLTLPLAALLLAWRGAGGAVAARMALGFAGFAALVMAVSWWQVKRGRWQHVDASARDERRWLNRFLLALLIAGAAFSHWSGSPQALTWGLAISAALIALALASARACKLSLHLAFAVYAAALLAQVHPAWGAIALAFAVLVAWSRLALDRHTPVDLIAGALAGAAAGAAFWWLAPRLPG